MIEPEKDAKKMTKVPLMLWENVIIDEGKGGFIVPPEFVPVIEAFFENNRPVEIKRNLPILPNSDFTKGENTARGHCRYCNKVTGLDFSAEIESVSFTGEIVHVIVEARCKDCGRIIRGGEVSVDMT